MTAPLAPRLHVRPPSGWLNDPNGIGFWDGRWHVMFQWNPNAPVHADVHWGHASSADLLTWRDEGLALAPRPGSIDATGAWSGVAVVEDGAGAVGGAGGAGGGGRGAGGGGRGAGGGGRGAGGDGRDAGGDGCGDDGDPARVEDVALVYTACRSDARDSGVAVARRAEGARFAAPDAWVAPHPDGWRDVRDPFVLDIAGERYAIQGAGRLPRGGALLVYRVPELDAPWELLGELSVAEDLADGLPRDGDAWECPQLVRVGSDWVLVVSWFTHEAGGVRQGVTAYVGSVAVDDASVPRFVARTGAPLDLGPDFYAPQLVVDRRDGIDRVLVWGWSWEGRGVGADLVPRGTATAGRCGVVDPATNLTTDDEVAARGWAGTLTFPRELDVVDGVARQVPARELAGLRGSAVEVVRAGDGWATVGLGPAFGARLVDGAAWELVLAGSDGERCALAGVSAGGMTVLVDGSIVEVFDEAATHTRRVYPRDGESWVLRARTAEAVGGESGSAPEVWELRAPAEA
ncbi:MAG: glycoside hydrolase family 32 protein [Salana multivorans]|uniref:glycoside hydrolase family 32 protein n=1 Tax=Salana multivorans TaxID=120377 RepID=UPI00095B4F66|nr:glycoside hydrolase family 32 protein [Salana multivorans]MBN8882023.1 glycoside hydrolase family 32 protein [Salana multivorans]OJX96172.1 MAG: hypothetical protein BGO96_07870 [Micrococcales bacterium 73-15]